MDSLKTACLIFCLLSSPTSYSSSSNWVYYKDGETQELIPALSDGGLLMSQKFDSLKHYRSSTVYLDTIFIDKHWRFFTTRTYALTPEIINEEEKVREVDIYARKVIDCRYGKTAILYFNNGLFQKSLDEAEFNAPKTDLENFYIASFCQKTKEEIAQKILIRHSNQVLDQESVFNLGILNAFVPKKTKDSSEEELTTSPLADWYRKHK